MASKRWIVTASSPQQLGEVADKAKETGFEVGEVLKEIGCLTGTAGDDVADKLRAIPEVIDVREEDVIDIGPPGADTTW